MSGVIFVLALIAAVAFAVNFHVVRTSKGTFVIPRTHMGVIDPYVDIRSWRWTDLWAHRQAAAAIVAAGHGDELPQVEQFNAAVKSGVQTLREFDEKHKVREGVEKGVDRATEAGQKLLDRVRSR